MTTATELCGHRWRLVPHTALDRPYAVHLNTRDHRCAEPAAHADPCRCRCGATTTRGGSR